jgi:hypothetical protein
VAFLDSDDEWVPDKLQIQIQLLAEYNVEFIASNYINIIEKTGEIQNIVNFGANGIIPSTRIMGGKDIVEIFIQNQSSITTPSVICRRDLFSKYGCFHEGLRNSEDKEMWWRFIQADVKFLFTDHLLYYRHKLNEGLVDYSLIYMENQINGLDIMFQDIKISQSDDLTEYFSRRLNKLLKHYFSQCLLERKSLLINSVSIYKKYKIVKINPWLLIRNVVGVLKQRIGLFVVPGKYGGPKNGTAR